MSDKSKISNHCEGPRVVTSALTILHLRLHLCMQAQIADKQRRRAKEVSEKLQDQQAAAQQELDIKARIESALSQSAANLPALANNPRHKLDW